MPNVSVPTTEPVLAFDNGVALVAFIELDEPGETALYNNDLLTLTEYASRAAAAADIVQQGLTVETGRWPKLDKLL